MNPHWPILKTYDSAHLLRIALPLGGIGTGTISLGGRGDLRDWEIVNRPAKGYTPEYCIFALQMQSENGAPITRVLEGALDPTQYEGATGSAARNHGLPRFRDCRFETAYPFGQVVLSDPDVPLQVRLQAFNPLVPGDAKASGWPLAVLRYDVTNPTDQTIRASICGNLNSLIGTDGTDGKPENNCNKFRQQNGLAGLFCDSQLDPNSPLFGTLALAVLDEPEAEISYRTNWKADGIWRNGLLDFWDDFSEDGRLENREFDEPMAMASLATAFELKSGETREVTFLLGWHFPNRLSWSPPPQDAESREIIGNFYSTQWENAWDVLEKAVPQLARLEAQTLSFVNAFCASDWPESVKEAALFNLSTLRSNTCFRTPDGHFFGWEGCHDKGGSCFGSCTHVWNYEVATAFLFGDLSRSMREIEFAHATRDDGSMSYRVHLPLSRAAEHSLAAADGQMGCLLKLFRDWQLSGDDDWLRKLWPHAKKALEFCWLPGGWDADCDGVMEGCQHNTMDVEYYGPNPQMQGWYLGALRAAEEMAAHLGEADFAAKCRQLFEHGSRWMDENLWNGEYYEHHIEVPSEIRPGLRSQMGACDLAEPDFQLGAGCLVDQLVGQYLAHICGLGYLHDPEKVRATLENIVRFNRKTGFHGHFNNMRSYVLGDERAVLMASYPRGNRPNAPFPYFTEVMTGFEYTAAIGLMQEGETEAGVQIIEDIRARYDGRKRSPFNEAECGHHYARAMASWAAIVALSGFSYSAVTKILKFKASAQSSTVFWSNGAAWGTIQQNPNQNGCEIRLQVLFGELEIERFELKGCGERVFPTSRAISSGEAVEFRVERS